MSKIKKVVIAKSKNFSAIGLDDDDLVLGELLTIHDYYNEKLDLDNIKIFHEYSFSLSGLNDNTLASIQDQSDADLELDLDSIKIFHEYVVISDEIHRHDIIESVSQRLEAIVEVNLERSEVQKLIEFSRKAEIKNSDFLRHIFELFGANIIYPSGSTVIW